MEFNQLVKNIEAMIFSSDRPLTETEIIELVNNRHENQGTQDEINFEEEISEEQVQKVIETIIEKYDQEFYPFEVKYSGGGYSFLTKPEYHEIVAPVCQDKKIKKLSSAAMETLAIIAYKQPVTKAEIEYIRGVSAEYSVQKLMEKELIVIAGRKEDAIGKPLLYRTTENFTDYLGIESFDDLPRLSELFEVGRVMASRVDEDGQTVITEEVTAEESAESVDTDTESHTQHDDTQAQEPEDTNAHPATQAEHTENQTENAAAQNSANSEESAESPEHRPLIRVDEPTTEGVDLENRKEQLSSLESETSIEETEE